MNAQKAGKGTNIDNATRQQLDTLLRDDKFTRGWTADEKAALKEAVLGTPMSNVMRALGQAAPTGIVSTALSGGAGFGLLGPVGAVALPAAGHVAKKTADTMREKSAQRLVDIILAGGSKEAAQGAPNIVERLTQEQRDAIIRALMAGGAVSAPAALQVQN